MMPMNRSSSGTVTTNVGPLRLARPVHASSQSPIARSADTSGISGSQPPSSWSWSM
jgi:hypothetical protein